MTDTTDTDTRTFGEWLRDYVNDAERVAEEPGTGAELACRLTRVDTAHEILEMYEQAQADEQERT